MKVTKTVTITELLANKIEDATKGLIPSVVSIICDYVSALGSEIKLSDRYRQSIINTLTTLSRVSNKGFKDFTREDVIKYLNRFRKEENIDPTHKWIGTYNTNLVNVCCCVVN